MTTQSACITLRMALGPLKREDVGQRGDENAGRPAAGGARAAGGSGARGRRAGAGARGPARRGPAGDGGGTAEDEAGRAGTPEAGAGRPSRSGPDEPEVPVARSPYRQADPTRDRPRGTEREANRLRGLRRRRHSR